MYEATTTVSNYQDKTNVRYNIKSSLNPITIDNTKEITDGVHRHGAVDANPPREDVDAPAIIPKPAVRPSRVRADMRSRGSPTQR